ncbi:MAG: hypothetical protein LBP59_08030 [Planctomycetaceae bacterium]|jgi:hypothetical protein|nr:hypothetical protein [Planctomycetaceae bacterium]
MKISRFFIFVALIFCSQFIFAKDISSEIKKNACPLHREVVSDSKSSKSVLVDWPDEIWYYQKVTISPQKFTSPFLKYRLNVLPSETEYDNARIFYVEAAKKFDEIYNLRLRSFWQSKDYAELSEKYDYDKIRQLEFKRFPLYSYYGEKNATEPITPKDEEDLYKDLKPVYKLLEKGSYSRSYNFSTEKNLSVKKLNILLNEVQTVREMGRYLHDKADWEIRNGKFDDAIKTIKTGFALGNHVKQTASNGTFMNVLVGIAINNVMYSQLFHLVSQPDAPNLYPALTQIYVNYKTATDMINGEQEFLFNQIAKRSVLDNIDNAPEEVCKDIFNRLIKVAGDFMDVSYDKYDDRNDAGRQQSFLSSLACLVSYSPALKRLRDRGLSEEEIKSLSVYQVVTPYIVASLLQVYDAMSVEMTFDPWESYDAVKFDDRGTPVYSEYVNPVELLLSQLVIAVRASKIAVRREVQLLDRIKIVEAVRYYAAVHDGKLPESLDAIKELPVPKICPITGKPYNYKVIDGKRIILDFRMGWRGNEEQNNELKPNMRMEIVLE